MNESRNLWKLGCEVSMMQSLLLQILFMLVSFRYCSKNNLLLSVINQEDWQEESLFTKLGIEKRFVEESKAIKTMKEIDYASST